MIYKTKTKKSKGFIANLKELLIWPFQKNQRAHSYQNKTLNTNICMCMKYRREKMDIMFSKISKTFHHK